MSTDDSAETQRDSGIDWLLGFRFVLLLFAIAGILGNAVTVSWWARLVLDNFAAINAWIRDSLTSFIFYWFRLDIDWQIQRTLPVLAVMLTVLGIGLLRTRFDLTTKPLPIERRLILFIVAGCILATLTQVQALYGPKAPGEPEGYQAMQKVCHNYTLNLDITEAARCTQKLADIAKPWPYRFQTIDWVILFANAAVVLGIAFLYPIDFIAAAFAASAFLALGHVDFRLLVTPS